MSNNPYQNTPLTDQYMRDLYMTAIQQPLMNTKPYSQAAKPSPQDIINDLDRQIASLIAERERIQLDTPLKSPTQRTLNANPALQNAWNEMMVIWNLIGDNK